MKINFKSVLLIVGISSLLGLLINYLNPDGIPFIREERKLNWTEDSSKVNNVNEQSDKIDEQNTEEEFDEAKAITLKQAYSLFKQNVLFVDARDYVEYEIGHIKNAISIPYFDFDIYKSILDTIPKNTPLVAYCDGKDCDLSILLGDKLFEMGYTKTYIFFGGWVDWQMAGYPVEGDDE